ncbi:MAG: dephospho-CoA kinase [Oscillospiraceae bacterium]|nr:dephospho-CoA kinase [Oscillospiraceae bacterium]
MGFMGINVVGLTGQSGAGKSTVSEIMQENGMAVVNADAVSHFVAQNPEFLKEVKAIFTECVGENGLDRQKLAGIVFNDKQLLQTYAKIIYPYIIRQIFKEIEAFKADGEKIVILDAPTLFESGLDDICSAVISVVAPFEAKIARILERDGIPVELVKSRLSSQNSEDFFAKKSDILINNSGSREELAEKVQETAKLVREMFNV